MKFKHFSIFSGIVIFISSLFILSCTFSAGQPPNTGDEEDPTTPVDISTLSRSVAHLPSPADLFHLEDAAKSATARTVYSDQTQDTPTGFMLANYMANGGFHAYAAIFYGEALAGLRGLGDVPKDTSLELAKTSVFYGAWFSEYTQKATWTTVDSKTLIKVSFKSAGYLINTLITLSPDADDPSKCNIQLGIHLVIGSQNGYFFSDFSERTRRFVAYIDLGDTGGGHAYMTSQKNPDGSISFGMMNDPYAYFYGYKDSHGTVLSGYKLADDSLEGSEYTNAAGEYQCADEINGSRIPLYRFDVIPGISIGYDEEDSSLIWIDTDGDGAHDDGEEIVPGEVKSTWYLRYYDAGYYYCDSHYIPYIDLAAIPATHTLFGRFAYKQGYEIAQTAYLDSKLDSVKTNVSLDYVPSSYAARITSLESETFPE